MPDPSSDVLLECLVESLQTFAFIAAEPAEAPSPAPAVAHLYRLPFAGRISGELQLAAPPELGGLMAANLLGLEPTDDQAVQRAQDVVKELCNIITGLWLRRTATDDAPEMGLPTSRELPAWDLFVSQPGALAIVADGFPLVARMEVES